MNKKEYLSEEKYQKIKKILITLGFISLAVGVILLVLAILVKVPEEPSLGDPNWWGNSKISSDAESKKALLFFFSFVFGIMLPAMLFGTAYKRENRVHLQFNKKCLLNKKLLKRWHHLLEKLLVLLPKVLKKD